MNLNVFADNAAELNAKPEQIAAHQRLVDQAVKAFGAQHYDHYEFLLSISDQLGGIGLEHHRSSENGVTPGYFTEWDAGRAVATCCRTSSRTAGMASSGAARTCGPRLPHADARLAALGL